MRTLRPSSLTIRFVYAICLVGAGVSPRSHSARTRAELGPRWNVHVRLRVLDGAGAFDPLAAVLLLARDKARRDADRGHHHHRHQGRRASRLGWHRAWISTERVHRQCRFLLFVLSTVRFGWPQRRSLKLSGDVGDGDEC